MVVLVVGADRLGKIPSQLRKCGVEEIMHWDGRSKSYQNRKIPQKVDRVIVFCDFINHNLMNSIRKQSKSKRIPVTFSKRAVLAV